jgi:hypothetical protein
MPILFHRGGCAGLLTAVQSSVQSSAAALQPSDFFYAASLNHSANASAICAHTDNKPCSTGTRTGDAALSGSYNVFMRLPE